MVSDFGLVEAIESGIVRFPASPSTTTRPPPTCASSTLAGIKDGLPKKSRKEGTVTPDQMPGLLEAALNALYDSYAKAFAAWENSDARSTASLPRLHHRLQQHHRLQDGLRLHRRLGEAPQRLPGRLGARQAPAVLQCRSRQTGPATAHHPRRLSPVRVRRGLSPEFKKIAATEIEEFRAEYARRVPGRKAEEVDDGQIMREVMNTVGKAGKLGEPVRCVVSVSMLTEGWDANTVTHILGVRAFGTQLLCEQVVGRGLRRRSYEPDENGLFTPEYADVYGVPFQFMPTVGKDGNRTIKPTRSVHACRREKRQRSAFRGWPVTA